MYLVTGATGNVGNEVVEQLLANGEKVRVFTRDAAKVAHWNGRVQVATGDFERADTFARAVAGVESVFLMNGGPAAENFKRLVDAAKDQGVSRIVFLSSLAAARPEFQIGRLHKEKEDAIRNSGLQGKFIRPGGFMSNSYQWIRTIKTEGTVYNLMGSGKFAPIAPEDIARVAVKALTDPGLSGEVFEITGGELMDVPQQVDILARILGKSIRCVDVPAENVVPSLIRAGIPSQIAPAVAQTFEDVRKGRGAMITDTIERVTGHPPMTFEAWARKHASRFM